ncbi:hypothetical protein BGX38DRAFT_1262552 [Terfezia claveryi]|nr:hypothetical protein BGX38DRAFT_1262552 [Terfezia claveryi]
MQKIFETTSDTESDVPTNMIRNLVMTLLATADYPCPAGEYDRIRHTIVESVRRSFVGSSETWGVTLLTGTVTTTPNPGGDPESNYRNRHARGSRWKPTKGIHIVVFSSGCVESEHGEEYLLYRVYCHRNPWRLGNGLIIALSKLPHTKHGQRVVQPADHDWDGLLQEAEASARNAYELFKQMWITQSQA